MPEAQAPMVPGSGEEWALETDAFRAANDPTVPSWVQEIIKDLWREVVAREPAVRIMLEKTIG